MMPHRAATMLLPLLIAASAHAGEPPAKLTPARAPLVRRAASFITGYFAARAAKRQVESAAAQRSLQSFLGDVPLTVEPDSKLSKNAKYTLVNDRKIAHSEKVWKAVEQGKLTREDAKPWINSNLIYDDWQMQGSGSDSGPRGPADPMNLMSPENPVWRR